MTVRVHQGIAYFPSFETARDFGASIRGFPLWRVVEYERGFAVQVRPGGDYLNQHGIPSMQAAMLAFDRA